MNVYQAMSKTDLEHQLHQDRTFLYSIIGFPIIEVRSYPKLRHTEPLTEGSHIPDPFANMKTTQEIAWPNMTFDQKQYYVDTFNQDIEDLRNDFKVLKLKNKILAISMISIGVLALSGIIISYL